MRLAAAGLGSNLVRVLRIQRFSCFRPRADAGLIVRAKELSRGPIYEEEGLPDGPLILLPTLSGNIPAMLSAQTTDTTFPKQNCFGTVAARSVETSAMPPAVSSSE